MISWRLFYFCSMNVILFDLPEIRSSLLPFTYTRPVAEIRLGIFTITEKWRRHLQETTVSHFTQPYLTTKFPLRLEKDNLLINGALIPDPQILGILNKLTPGQIIQYQGLLLAAYFDETTMSKFQDPSELSGLTGVEIDHVPNLIKRYWNIFQNNGDQIREDIKLLDDTNRAEISDAHTVIYNRNDVWVEPGVSVKAAILNADNGPIYLGKNSEVNEGAIIRGPFALGESSTVRMGAKIRGNTTIGPFCNIGGEVSNSILFGYSNKAHDGYLGDSVIGEWCNMGADSNTSNLKNNYGEVKVWNYHLGEFEKSGQQFCGLMMGDHSKCGINTMFNTGSVVGVYSNIFGTGFPRTFVPSFAWGGHGGFSTYKLDKVIETTKRTMSRKQVELKKVDRDILVYLFDHTAQYRVWEEN